MSRKVKDIKNTLRVSGSESENFFYINIVDEVAVDTEIDVTNESMLSLDKSVLENYQLVLKKLPNAFVLFQKQYESINYKYDKDYNPISYQLSPEGLWEQVIITEAEFPVASSNITPLPADITTLPFEVKTIGNPIPQSYTISQSTNNITITI